MLADKLPITGPCPIDLDAIGFDRASKVSHCTHCVKSVGMAVIPPEPMVEGEMKVPETLEAPTHARTRSRR